MSSESPVSKSLEFVKVANEKDFPSWAIHDAVVDFIHENMRPYEDKIEDIERALEYIFHGRGGFVMLTRSDGKLAGVLVMLNTGMKGYIPENILLMVSVDPALRGQGVGKKLIELCIAECEGDVKLHVENENPARMLYDRVGFTTKYVEMRYHK